MRDVASKACPALDGDADAIVVAVSGLTHMHLDRQRLTRLGLDTLVGRCYPL